MVHWWLSLRRPRHGQVIPGIVMPRLMRDGLLVRNRSSTLFLLVGVFTVCSRWQDRVISKKRWLIFSEY